MNRAILLLISLQFCAVLLAQLELNSNDFDQFNHNVDLTNSKDDVIDHFTGTLAPLERGFPQDVVPVIKPAQEESATSPSEHVLLSSEHSSTLAGQEELASGKESISMIQINNSSASDSQSISNDETATVREFRSTDAAATTESNINSNSANIQSSLNSQIAGEHLILSTDGANNTLVDVTGTTGSDAFTTASQATDETLPEEAAAADPFATTAVQSSSERPASQLDQKNQTASATTDTRIDLDQANDLSANSNISNTLLQSSIQTTNSADHVSKTSSVASIESANTTFKMETLNDETFTPGSVWYNPGASLRFTPNENQKLEPTTITNDALASTIEQLSNNDNIPTINNIDTTAAEGTPPTSSNADSETMAIIDWGSSSTSPGQNNASTGANVNVSVVNAFETDPLVSAVNEMIDAAVNPVNSNLGLTDLNRTVVVNNKLFSVTENTEASRSDSAETSLLSADLEASLLPSSSAADWTKAVTESDSATFSATEKTTTTTGASNNFFGDNHDDENLFVGDKTLFSQENTMKALQDISTTRLMTESQTQSSITPTSEENFGVPEFPRVEVAGPEATSGTEKHKTIGRPVDFVEEDGVLKENYEDLSTESTKLGDKIFENGNRPIDITMTGADNNVDLSVKSKPEPEPSSEPKPEPSSKLEPEPSAEPEPEPSSKLEPEPSAEPELEPSPEPEPEPTADKESVTNLNAPNETSEPKPEPEPTSSSETDGESPKPEPEPEPKITELEPKAEPEPNSATAKESAELTDDSGTILHTHHTHATDSGDARENSFKTLFNFRITSIDYVPEFGDVNSGKSKKLRDQILPDLEEIFGSIFGHTYEGVHIVHFIKGSIVVDGVVYTSTKPTDMEELATEFEQQVTSKQLQVGGNDVDPRSISLNGFISKNYIQRVHEGYTSGSTSSYVVGGAIAVGVLAILIIAFAVIAMNNRRTNGSLKLKGDSLPMTENGRSSWTNGSSPVNLMGYGNGRSAQSGNGQPPMVTRLTVNEENGR